MPKKISFYLKRRGLYLAILFLFLLSLWLLSDTSWKDLRANLATELLGIVITVILIDALYALREHHLIRQRALREVASRDNGTALAAVRELAINGWLHDGTLTVANLTNANLSRAQLVGAQMTRISFTNSILAEANLMNANLEGALLMGTDLRNATLRNATCVGCNCPMANFAQADLTGVNFRGANLANANVSREQLSKVGMLRGAILPDGQLYDGSLDLAGDRQEAKNRGIDPEDTKRFKEYFLYSPEDEDFFWFRLFRKSFDRQQRGN